MLTIEGLISVIALCITCFSLGYNVGHNIGRNNARGLTIRVIPFMRS